MAKRPRTSFWSTVPGMLSAVAGVLGATAAILGALASLGWLGGSGNEHESASQGTSVDRVRLHYNWRSTPAATTFLRLDVRFVPADSRITMRCPPRDCFGRIKDRHVREATTNLPLVPPRIRVSTGATLEIRFVNARVGTKIWGMTARSPTPTFDVSCLRPGETVPSSC